MVCYLVSPGPGLPAAVLLLRPGLGSGLLSTVLLVWLGPVPRPTSLGYVLSRFPSSYFWNFYSRLWLFSSIIDHRSLLNSCFQDSFDVTLACADVRSDFRGTNCYCSGPRLPAQPCLYAGSHLSLPALQGQASGNFALNFHVSF